MSLPELSACPFCGHKAELRVPQKGYGLPFVACTHCSCEIGARATTPAEAITAWNTRTGQLVERDAVGVWPVGTRVTKIKGSKWTGRVVGHYSTDLTPEGYAVESETETGSVQIYPRAALTAIKGGDHADG